MSANDELRTRIYAFLVANLRVDLADIDDHTELFTSGLLDSFSLVELMTHVESIAEVRFGVLDVSIENLDCIRNIVSFVERKRG